jgi:RNA polymerase sigma-70 factor (ECF subfamily)
MLSFQDLYEAYAKDVYRFALWMAGDRYEAEDICSETMVRAWARRSKIRTETLKAYLFTIARNIYLGKLRKRKRQLDLDEAYPDPAPGPEAVAEAHLKILRVRGILQTLPEIDRTAFVMRVQHELPYAEIARALGLSQTNAKVKVHRVRQRLLARFLDGEATES